MDATPLSVPSGGVQRYTAELARALAKQYTADSYHLLSDQPFELPGEFPNLHRGAGPSNWVGRRWWTIGLPRELRRGSMEVFHGTDFSVPYFRVRPSVMTIHDLSPWREGTAEYTSPRVRRRTPILLALNLATMVITPSEAIRREVLARFSLAPDRVVATPLAASYLFRPVEPPPRDRPYYLCVGSTNPRKNLDAIRKACRELSADADLVFIAGDTPDAELPALYSGAAAFLYPSLYEGFGLPVVEAMRCGAMVIASKDPAVTEVAGGAAIHVDAVDVHGWVAAMRTALSPECRALWRDRSLARGAEFSWKKTAMRTHEVYEEARRRF